MNPLEEKWKATIHFVLDHLLPGLRTRQLRGAVVQALSDTIGVSVPSTARLLDVVLRSRRQAGEPLLKDFLALLGTGLTGAYCIKNNTKYDRNQTGCEGTCDPSIPQSRCN